MLAQEREVVRVGFERDVEQIADDGDCAEQGVYEHVGHHLGHQYLRQSALKAVEDNRAGDGGRDDVTGVRDEAEQGIQSDAADRR